MDTKMEEGASSMASMQSEIPMIDVPQSSMPSSSFVKIPSPSNGNRATGLKTTSSMSKRQQAAHRARMEALTTQLKTRLQYAVFKVEHGWSKQTLSEVENLYYKHRRASGSNLSSSGVSNAKKSPQAQRSGSGNGGGGQKNLFMPSTPTPQSRTTSPTTVRKHSNSNPTADVFGGLVTPPPSGGTLPVNQERYKDLFSTGNHSFASGINVQQSPSVGASAVMGNNTFNGKSNHSNNNTSQNSSKAGKSYADFWSKIGSANNGSSTDATNHSNRSSS